MSFIENICLSLFDKQNNIEKLQYIIDEFSKEYDFEIIYSRPDAQVPFLFSDDKTFNTLCYNYSKIVNIVLDCITDFDKAQPCLQYINEKTKHKYIYSDTVIITDGLKSYTNYIHIYLSDIELLKKLKFLVKFIKQEEYKYFYEYRLVESQKFETVISKSFNVQIKEDKIDILLKYLIRTVVQEYKMTCGYIVECHEGNYYPTITYSCPDAECRYGLYEYKGNDGPWEILDSLDDINNHRYIYDLDEKYKKYFKTDSFPKSVFMMKFTPDKSSHQILFFLTNNCRNIALNGTSIKKLLLLFRSFGLLVNRKNRYRNNIVFINDMKLKLEEWKNHDFKMQKQSNTIQNRINERIEENIQWR